MAGYGNRTAHDPTAESLAKEHSHTRLNLTDSHSPPTYGAGFGNKRAASEHASAETEHASTETEHASTETKHAPVALHSDSNDDSAPRFDTQGRHGSAPYSNAHTHGSASTAGAGWGNKTGSFARDEDSTLGRVMERVGGVVGSAGLVERGREKREARGEEAGVGVAK
ncbi:uncharacterized protein M421DRAFT_7747 [Didymella exigua CBS 183.55]|uniref:Uncharacterized protein n=1 Tax=Didymella exigua CBS 183.55 TaxID=1150837 RepID=A0A6A5RE40_9PLEO|nr:uncharacterized protein M421DRAFT_7747 [Didymella exigua CBS 183.55]KAF1925733.1 hypothetical protein M421DRAFT_7747 [Didymella exigua CBS 183.55]